MTAIALAGPMRLAWKPVLYMSRASTRVASPGPPSVSTKMMSKNVSEPTIIPVYLIIIKLGLYDSLLAIILPSIAFAIPLSVLVLSNFIRDVPKELFESMRMDGATDWGTLWHLAFPLTRPALVTVTIYNGLLIWNGFLLPLILTQSPGKRTLPLALWTFQGQYSVNVPAVLASVMLTTLPILILYALGRRQLLSGLTAGFGK